VSARVQNAHISGHRAGRKQSGYGIGGIPWTMHEMTQQKMLVFRR